jgi:hypothetical protein
MHSKLRFVFWATLLVTAGSITLWQATGGDYYTKYQVVEQTQQEADPNDPLVAAGFYDGSTQTQSTVRDEFRFGLLPTPQGVFDKHVLSVATLVTPFWILTLGLFWLNRRRLKATPMQAVST